MFVLMNGQGLAFHDTGANSVGTLAGLAPVSSQPQPGPLEHFAFGRRRYTVENDPAGIGQQYRVPGPRQLLMQTVHLVPGDLQHLLQTLATFQNAPVLQHRRCNGLCGIEVVVLQAALPGTDNRRVAPLGAALGDIENLPGVPA